MDWQKRYSGPHAGAKVKVISYEDGWSDMPWGEGEILTLDKKRGKHEKYGEEWYTKEHGDGNWLFECEFEIVGV